ncbi:MAG: hypothetical protein OHK0013_31810 [Sandaracinaceae bacterium]
MTAPALTVVLARTASAIEVAKALFARLFPERALDPSRVAVERAVGGHREIWLGAEGTGIRVVRERASATSRDGDEVFYEVDVRYEAGRADDARWLRIDLDDGGVRVQVGHEDASIVPALRDLAFRAGTGRSETMARARDTLAGLPGFPQNSFGTPPSALERTRVPFVSLSPREDRPLEAILADLDAAAREDGSEAARRAAVVAAVVRLRNGRLEEGLAGLEAALAAHPDEPDVAGLRALVLVRAGRLDEARRALASAPIRDEHEYLTRLLALHELGDLEAVLAQLDGPAPKPSEVHARIAAAVIAERLGDHEGALTRAREVMAREPHLGRGVATRGPLPDTQPLLHRLGTLDTWRALLAEIEAARS